MFFNVSKVVRTLAAFAATASAVPSKPQAGLVKCNILLQGEAPVNATNVNALESEFNYTLGRALSIETGGSIYSGATEVLTSGDDNSFDINKSLSAVGKTSAKTAAIVTGWIGQTKEGLAINWLILAAECV